MWTDLVWRHEQIVLRVWVCRCEQIVLRIWVCRYIQILLRIWVCKYEQIALKFGCADVNRFGVQMWTDYVKELGVQIWSDCVKVFDVQMWTDCVKGLGVHIDGKLHSHRNVDFFTCTEITSANSHNNSLFFHFEQSTDAGFWFYQIQARICFCCLELCYDCWLQWTWTFTTGIWSCATICILWQIDAAMQQPDTNSNVSYATVFLIHQRRPSLGNG
jgi:hypothetical protein